MRFLFKTSYNQDIRIFRDKVDIFWYGLLAVAVLGEQMTWDRGVAMGCVWAAVAVFITDAVLFARRYRLTRPKATRPHVPLPTVPR